MKQQQTDYADAAQWLYRETERTDCPTDVFFICPTVCLGTEQSFWWDEYDETNRAFFKMATDMEKGIYDARSRFFAPYYHQLALSAYSLPEKERLAYLEPGYADVKAAFSYYLERENSGRPFILAGFSQGAELCIRLLKEFGAPENMIACYAIGWRITEEELRAYPQLRPAAGETDTGVIVLFNSEAEWITDSLLVPAGVKTVGINPLNWKTDATPAPKECNLGSCVYDLFGRLLLAEPGYAGARLDPARGTLKITGIPFDDYPETLIFPKGVYHLYDYQFFFGNLRENVQKRIDAYLKKQSETFDITKIDANFQVETELKRDNLQFYDAEQPPFSLHGVFRDGDRFRRLPLAVARTVNEGVAELSAHTAGGRIRFTTDSDFVAIHAEMTQVSKMYHMAFSGSICFDLFERTGDRQHFCGTFLPKKDVQEEYESLLELGERKKRTLTIEFPLYSGVKKLYIGLNREAELLPPEPYAVPEPVVYYGSSITQGGCASKPGSAYQNILSARLDCDYVNLGFSGSGRGEETAAEYIAGLPMSAFVLDYDHNAPTPEHLRRTHERFFRIIRERRPGLPVLFLTRPKYGLTEEEKERREIIRETYERATAAGDRNVYFLDGPSMMGEEPGDNGTVDGTHPTDSGFLCMANAIEPVLRTMLKRA